MALISPVAVSIASNAPWALNSGPRRTAPLGPDPEKRSLRTQDHPPIEVDEEYDSSRKRLPLRGPPCMLRVLAARTRKSLTLLQHRRSSRVRWDCYSRKGYIDQRFELQRLCFAVDRAIHVDVRKWKVRPKQH